MKTEKLPKVPTNEPGDFYYHHLRLPYGNYDPAKRDDFPFEPDPTIQGILDVSSDDEEQLGFVILRKDHTVEVVDTVTGEHIRITFGEKKKRSKKGEAKHD